MLPGPRLLAPQAGVLLQGRHRIRVDSIDESIEVLRSQRMLGTVISDDGTIGAELAKRVRKASASSLPLAREVYSRRALAVRHKLTITDAISHSQLFYNACTWPELVGEPLANFTRQYHLAHAQALWKSWRARVHGHITNLMVVQEAQRLQDCDALRLARVRLLPRVLQHAPRQLRALLNAGWELNYGWAQQLRHDLSTVREYADPDEVAAAMVLDNMAEWARNSPEAYKREHSVTNTDRTPAFQDQSTRATPRFCCYECGFADTSRLAVAKHRAQEHPSQDDPRRWAQGTACQICRKDYHMINRLCRHLSRAAACARAWKDVVGGQASDALFHENAK
ncbi:unnamed protein product, partial [Prorocentrum cordatum]